MVSPQSRYSVLSAHAFLAELDPDLEHARQLYTDAAQSWARFGNMLERGHALLGLGRCLLALGSGGEATPLLREARELFAGLRARRLETEATLAETVHAARP